MGFPWRDCAVLLRLAWVECRRQDGQGARKEQSILRSWTWPCVRERLRSLKYSSTLRLQDKHFIYRSKKSWTVIGTIADLECFITCTTPYLYEQSRQNPRSRALCSTRFVLGARLGWKGPAQNLDRRIVSTFSPLSPSVMMDSVTSV